MGGISCVLDCGIDSRIWGSGMGRYRCKCESAVCMSGEGIRGFGDLRIWGFEDLGWRRGFGDLGIWGFGMGRNRCKCEPGYTGMEGMSCDMLKPHTGSDPAIHVQNGMSRL
eukprot:1162460-Amorphochlora_amoeboformis.AAC.2